VKDNVLSKKEKQKRIEDGNASEYYGKDDCKLYDVDEGNGKVIELGEGLKG